MLSENRRDLTKGIALLLSFAAVFILLFMPIINGVTPIHFLDNLYNSISKGSVYYIEALQEESQQYRGTEVGFSLELGSPAQAKNIAEMFLVNGAQVEIDQSRVTVSGDLGAITGAILVDADYMFANNGDEVLNKYNREEKQVLYSWWVALKAMDKELKRQKRFSDASFVHSVLTKAVECSFNYYGIDSSDIGDQAYVVILSLGFYVFYTVWFGYAILFSMTGLGLKL